VRAAHLLRTTRLPRSDAGAGYRTAWPRSARLRHRGWTSCHQWERTSLSAGPGKIARRG